MKWLFIEYAFLLVKDDECDSDAENEQNHDPNVEEFLQQQDTAVIYPEAPEDDQRQGTPEASGHDENGNWSSRPLDSHLWRIIASIALCGNPPHYREHFWKREFIADGNRE